MEKPGMGRRYFRIGPGLLGFFALIAFFLWPAFSEETGDFPDPDYYAEYNISPEAVPPEESAKDLETRLETFPEIPKVYDEWMIRILVNHPNPQDVSVVIPALPSFLVLDRIRTAPWAAARRTAKEAGAETTEKWTAVDFFFIPCQGGPVSLAPFEVRVPGHLGYSPPVSVLVRGEAVARAAWEPFPPSLTIGQQTEIRLRLMTGQAEERQSALISCRLEAPLNAIVESLDIAEANPGEFVLRFLIIPLEGSFVRLPPSLLKYGDISLTVPSREFTVLPKVPAAPAIPPMQRSAPLPDREDPAQTGPPPPFPDARGAVFPLFRAGYELALEEARSYWDRGLYAEALAVLRLNERERAAGPVLASLRRDAETALGLELTEDERWRPRQIFLFLAAAAAIILIFILLCSFVRRAGRKIFFVTSGLSWGYTFILIFLCGILGTALYGFFGGPGRTLYSGRSHTGVLRETGSFRVPEEGSVPDTFFREGEAVRIRSLTNAWAYIETFEGKAGWVPLDRIIPY
jgi:hypothetical protein